MEENNHIGLCLLMLDGWNVIEYNEASAEEKIN